MKFTHFGAIALAATLAACSGGDSQTAGQTSGTAQAGAGAGAGAGSRPVPGSEEDLAANVGDRVYFDFDKSTLTQQATATLDRQASWLAQYPSNAVQVAGNCDERGTVEYNIALGQRRAYSVTQYLAAHGVAQSRIATISYGKERPIAVGSDEASWQQNRNAITSLQ